MARCESESILGRLRLHAEQFPDRVLYTYLQDDKGIDSLTFGQLRDRVYQTAAWLREFAGPGERALLLYPPGLAFVEAFLSCLAAGIVAVPAYPPRRNRNAQRLQSIVEDARPRLVLSVEGILSSFATSGMTFSSAIRCLATDSKRLERTERVNLEPVAVGPETVAFLQYTSGSTRSPRGVMITQGNLTANEKAIEKAFDHTQESVMGGWLPVFHDMGLIGMLLQPLHVGFPAILFSPTGFLQSPLRWLKMISEYGVTTSGAPNFAYDLCARSVTEEQKVGLDLRSWNIAYNGAEPVRAGTLDRFTEAFGSCGFRPRAFFPCYGMAESTLLVSGGPVDREVPRMDVCEESLARHRVCRPTEGKGSRELVCSGQVTVDAEVVVVKVPEIRRCQSDEVGEIWVKSPSVAVGYWNLPQESKETFRARLPEEEGEYLRTGDLGFLCEEGLYVTGRLKDLIILRGRNVYPQDVEEAIEGVVPFARANASAAFGVEWAGEEGIVVVIEADRQAVVQAAGGAKVATLDAVIARVREVVSMEFEATVHAVVLVRPGQFPRTSSGKVQRRACREGFLSGTLEVVYSWRAEGACETVRQETVLSGGGNSVRELVLQSVLNWIRGQIDRGIKNLDPDTDFVAMGIDSVGAVSIALELEKATGRRVEMDVLNEHRTINQLVRHLECAEVGIG